MTRKELINKVDEEIAAFALFFIVLATSKDFLLALLIGVVTYFIVYFLTEKPVEVQESIVNLPKKPTKSSKLSKGEVPIADNYNLNILNDSIFITAIKRYGKSVLLYTILIGIHKHFTPNTVQVLLIDLKKTSMRPFTKSPFIVNNKVYTDNSVLEVLEDILEKRQKEFLRIDSSTLVDNLDTYHNVKGKNQPSFAHLLVIIDELQLFSDDDISRLDKVHKVAGSYGITYICATQRGVATIPPKFLSQLDVRCSGYQSNTKEYKYAGLTDDAIVKMSKTKGLFAVGSDGEGYEVIQTTHTTTQEINDLAKTFEVEQVGVQLGTSAIQNNVLCLDWYRTLDTKPSLAEIQEYFSCDKSQADKFSKLWRKK